MKKKLFLYPYTNSMDSLLKLRNELEEYEITAVGCFQEDEGYLQERYPEMKVVCSYEEGLKEADTLLLNVELEEQMKEEAKACKAYALAQKKEILEKEGFFEVLEDVRGYELKTLEIPVLAVMGAGEHCSKFETASVVAARIRERGYRVLAISPNAYAIANKMERIPDYFFRDTVDLKKKIINFNRYVSQLCETWNPDILVLEIPGGIFPVGKIEYFYFGEFTMIASEALEIEAAVYNLYENVQMLDEREEKNYLKAISEHCLQKYRIPISFFCMSSQHIKPDKEAKKVDFLYLSDKFLQKEGNRPFDENLVLLSNRKAVKEKVDQILRELTENAEVI